MEQIFTIPEGFEIKKIGDNQFSIVEKKEPAKKDTQIRDDEENSEFYHDIDVMGDLQKIKLRQMNAAVTHRNSFFTAEDNRDDYDFDTDIQNYYSEKIPERRDKKSLWDEHFKNPWCLHDMYESGKIKKLNEYEMNLLRFCNGINVKGFLKEEFKNNPINIKNDDNGIIQIDTPNGIKNLGNTNPDKYKKM